MGRTMKRTFTTFTCALLLLGAARANSAEQKYPNLTVAPIPMNQTSDRVESEAAYIGDFDSIEGDEQAVAFVGDYVGDTDFVGDAPSIVNESLAADPVPMPDGASGTYDLPMTTALHTGSHYTGSHYSSTSYSSASRQDDNWLRGETLLWFTESRNTPPLVTTGNALENKFGSPLDSGLAPGFRLDYGKYFHDGKLGVGARFWGLYGEEENYSINSADPAFNIQRPFFDTFFGANDALIVSGTQGPNQFTGSFDATSDFDLIATEAYGRILFGQAQNFRIDLIGGYSYFGIDDSLAITSSTIGGAIPGQVRTFTDRFEAENHFHGGQLGFETQVNKGRWSMISLTKVHMGNMNQRMQISGSSVSDLPPVGPPTITNYNNGFFVQGQQGTYEQNEFTFVPELNLKLGYQLRNNVHFTVGYSFLFWSSLALAGEQIDANIDQTLLLSDTANPLKTNYQIRDKGFWMQGIDLGLVFDF